MTILEAIPRRIAALPVDPQRGLPVPWFVHWGEDGKPDFRVIGKGKFVEAIKFEKCWICGQQLGRWHSFLIGPMCAVSRVTSEPPAHEECAQYAAKACPFLSRPNMRRREKGLPENIIEQAGTPIDRNPGCVVIWTTRAGKWGCFDGKPGVLIGLNASPTKLEWIAEGRPATRAEVVESIDSGLPLLVNDARERGGEPAVSGLMQQRRNIEGLLPL